MLNSQKAFTLVEVLVISPIVVLFIGAFVGLLVTLTGESLVIREKNQITYNTQDSLNDIRADISLATGFLETSHTPVSPQGKNSSAAPFTDKNTDTNNTSDSLILKLPATTQAPSNAARTLIYTGTPCDSKNPLYTYTSVYFVAFDTETTTDPNDKSLYKRTISPSTPAPCVTPWQKGSCKRADITVGNSSWCQRSDERLLENITAMEVKYFDKDNVMSDNGATTAVSASVTLTVDKQVAGNSINYSSSVQMTALNLQ